MSDTPFLKAITDEESDDPLLVLVSLEVEGEPEPFRFVDNDVDIESNGATYEAYGFGFVEPPQIPGQRALGQLQIDNLHYSIPETIRALEGAPIVKVQLVLASQPSVVSRRFPNFKFTNITWTNKVVTGDMETPYDFDEAVCSKRYNRRTAPALFS